MSPFVCYPRGGTPCIDDVCRSMNECAWPPAKEKKGIYNDTDKPVHGGQCSSDDPLAATKILQAVRRKTGRGDLSESDLNWETRDGMLGGWVYDGHHGPETQCLRPTCPQLQCQPAPWYGSGIEECCASGSCEVCRGEL